MRIHVDGGPVLEGRLAIPAAPRGGLVLCHPHPLYGGDMHNPVIMRAAEVCAESAVAALRFNFRGVGESGGTWAEGQGEREDLRAALRALARAVPAVPIGVLGYSFGAWIATLVACEDELADHRSRPRRPPSSPPGEQAAPATPRLEVGHADGPLAGLALVAPALGVSDFGCLPALAPRPLLLVAGTRDEFCPLDRFQALAARLPWATATVIDGADHFFFGKLFPLGEAVRGFAQHLTAQRGN